MRWQTTAVLAVVLIALAASYYVYEVRLGPERELARSREGRVLGVDLADVVEVTLAHEGRTIRLARDGEEWQILEPLRARGARGAVENTLTTLVTARVDREIAAAPESLAQYGLERPAAEVRMTVKDGRTLGLQLGSKNPTGVWVYARAADKPAVFTLSDTVLREATRAVDDFRDRTVLALDRAAVTGFDITGLDEALSVAKTDAGWALTRPRELRADTETIARFLDRVGSARVKEFVAESPRTLEPYGLGRPVTVAIHAGTDKDRATRTLLLGRVDPKKKGVYAMRAGEASVLLVPEEVWTDVPKNVGALRNKVVVEVEQDKVKQLDIERPEGTVTLVREDDRWRITRPEALPADQLEAGSILFKLQGLRALGFLSDDATGISRYLARPAARVTITEEGAEAPTTLLLAPSPDTRGGRATAYAGIAGRGPVMLVEATALKDLGKSLNELRDRTLVRGLEPSEVNRVLVARGGAHVVVERRGESEWHVLEPRKGAAKTGKVDGLLFGLRGLRWTELVAKEATDLARYGLDRPAAEVALFKADGGEIATVLVGREEGGRLYVRLKDAPAVYAIDPKRLTIPKVPDDFLG